MMWLPYITVFPVGGYQGGYGGPPNRGGYSGPPPQNYNQGMSRCCSGLKLHSCWLVVSEGSYGNICQTDILEKGNVILRCLILPPCF